MIHGFTRRRRPALLPLTATLSLLAALLGPVEAAALEAGTLGSKPVSVDISSTVVVSQRFESRIAEGERFTDGGWGSTVGIINGVARWDNWTLGARIDGAVYYRRPEDRSDIPEGLETTVRADGVSRFQNYVYPSKLWLTYARKNLEVTVGDSYVQFGRGLVLSMRKVDDVGVDNTVRGLKVVWSQDPFSITLVGGLANPARVDSATGRSIFLPRPTDNDSYGAQPLFGMDWLVGGQLVAGRGLPVLLSTHAVHMTRCAPYSYQDGKVVEGTLGTPFGSCKTEDTTTWLSTLPTKAGPLLNASQVQIIGQSLEIPKLFKHANLYVEAAIQRRSYDEVAHTNRDWGNALYGALTLSTGPVTTLVEAKSYRNFFPLQGSVNVTKAAGLASIQYSTPPTAELLMQDSMFGFYNACVNGGRVRSDVKLREGLSVYGQAIYAHTTSEIPGGECDARGRTIAPKTLTHDAVTSNVWDGLAGFEWHFDKHASYLFASAGVRDDTRESGENYYREAHFEYSLSKQLKGPISVEISGRHRLRKEAGENRRGGGEESLPWREGENYVAFKMAPKLVVTQGFEYTTRLGMPTYYWNGQVLWKITGDTNVKLFVGQQRGGLKCISGICKIVPAYEGARLEATVRF